MRTTLFGAVIAASATVAAGLISAPGALATPPHAQAPAPAAADRAIPAKYLDQKPVWATCDLPGTLCARIKAPLDWNRAATSPSIEIAISKARPKGGTAARLVIGNPGGPGGPGLFMAPFLAGMPGAKNHLAVGFDPRGTGASTQLSCAGAPASAYDYRDRSAAARGRAAYVSKVAQSFCRKGSGTYLDYVNTFQTVSDMNLIRAVLGYRTTDFLGYSGGTWMGAYFQKYFPAATGRFVLDSNTDFTAPLAATFHAQPQAFQRRFEADFQTWAAKYHASLHLGRTPAAVNAFYERLRADLVRRPIVLGVEGGAITVDGNYLDMGIASSLYTKYYFTGLVQTLLEIRQMWDAGGRAGTPSAATRAFLDRAQAQPLADPEDAMSATFLAITCNDTPWPRGQAFADAFSARQGKRYPLIGWSKNQNPCYYWNRPALTMPTPDGKGVGTTLMVQSVNDPATNARLAYAAHARYAGSILITVVKEGDHGIYGGGNRCVDDRVNMYLATGMTVTHDVTCEGLPIPAPDAKAGGPSVQEQWSSLAAGLRF